MEYGILLSSGVSVRKLAELVHTEAYSFRRERAEIEKLYVHIFVVLSNIRVSFI